MTQAEFWKTRPYLVRLAHAPEIEISKKYWMSFPEISPAYAPEIKISKKYWMSFPGFANKGKRTF